MSDTNGLPAQDATVESLFGGASKPVSNLWTGVNPDTAKSLYGKTDIYVFSSKPKEGQLPVKDIIGKEICIIGFKEAVNAQGVYYTYLFVPKQEPLVLGFFSLSSKPFHDLVTRSKLPVKGILEKVPCKKGSYWNLRA